MHRSRIAIVLIDVADEDHDAALGFWSGAAGVEPEQAAEGPYSALGKIGSARLEFQRTGAGTAPRVHLDIETDDVAAEVARLVQLGASEIEDRGDYRILRDPAGLPFCVVPVWTGDDFEADATTWR